MADVLGARLENAPEFAEAHYNLSFVLSTLGEYDAALRSVTRAQTIDPYYVPQKFSLSIDLQLADPLIADHEGQSGDQAPQFTGAVPVVHDHLNASTYIEKGWSLISLGDYNGAIQALSKALELAPDDPQAQSQLGWAQMLNGDYDNALGTFQQVLMKEPANSLARINVGYICLKKNIFGEAIEHLSKAIRLDNDKKATLYAHYYLGLVYFERGMYEDAQNFFQKTLQLGPNLIEAYFELGRAHWQAEDHDAARETWAKGFKANKLTTWGKRCKEALDRAERGEEPTP